MATGNQISVNISGDASGLVAATKQASDAVSTASTSTADSFKKMSDSADDSVSGFRGLADTSRGVGDVLSQFGIDLPIQPITDMALAGKDLAKGFSDLIGPALQKVSGFFGEATEATEGMTGATEAATGATEELDAAEDANPLGLIIGLVLALALGFVELYQHCQTFRDIINDIGDYLKLTLYGDFILIRDAVELVAGVLEDAFTAAFDVVKAAYDVTIGPIVSAISGISNAVTGGVSAVGGFFGGMFAAGGQVRGGAFQIVGENGPEAVSLPAGSQVTSNANLGSLTSGSGGDIVVQIDGTEIMRTAISNSNRSQRIAITAGSNRGF